MKAKFLFFLQAFIAINLYCQKNNTFICNFLLPNSKNSNFCSTNKFASKKIINLVDSLLLPTGIRRNFDVYECRKVHAAMMVATRDSLTIRYSIIINPTFISTLIENSNTDWSSIGVIAHEIGHYVSNHISNINLDKHQIELEADEWAGFALAKMGCKKWEALTAFQSLPKDATESHPSRDKRLDAVRRGWNRAQRQLILPDINSLLISNSGIDSFNNKKFKSAFYLLFKSSISNNINSQFYLSKCYEQGLGTVENTYEASYWLKKAAQSGNNLAQYELGEKYLTGNVLQKNFDSALYWFKQSSINGNSSAMHQLSDLLIFPPIESKKDISTGINWLFKSNTIVESPISNYKIGRVYELGIGLNQNFDSAFKYYKKSSICNNSFGQLFLGKLYELGNGVTLNYDSALKYYTLSIKNNNPSGYIYLGLLYKKMGDKSDVSKVIKFFNLNELSNNGKGYFNIGKLYEEGKLVNKDFDSAFKYYSLSASLGNTSASYKLGNFFYSNETGINNFDSAFKYYNASFTQNSTLDYINLAHLYYNGLFCKQNFALAFKLYRQSSNLGNPKGLSYIGKMFVHGYHVRQNFDSALFYFKKASYLNDSYGNQWLGYFFEKGISLNKNTDSSFYFYTKSALGGNFHGRKRLASLIINHDYYGKKQLRREKKYAKEIIRRFFPIAKSGDRYSKGILGDIKYLFELSLPMNIDTTINWYDSIFFFSDSSWNTSLYEVLEPNTSTFIRFQNYVRFGDYKESDECCLYKKFENHNIKNSITQAGIGDLYYQPNQSIMQVARDLGMPESLDSAAKWYKLSSIKGSAYGDFGLGNLCEIGYFGRSKGENHSLNYFKKASMKNHSEALTKLGYNYNKGIGVKKDKDYAIFLLKEALEMSYFDAEKYLRRLNANYSYLIPDFY